MATTERVTVTLPADMVQNIDRLERNRSRFIAQAVEHELAHRKREALLASIRNPHAESAELADMGLDDWQAGLPNNDDGLVVIADGQAVRWVAGSGWTSEGPCED